MKIPFLLLLPVSVLVFGCGKPHPVKGESSPQVVTPAASEAVAEIAGQPAASSDRPGEAPAGGGGNRGQRMEQTLASLNLSADQTQKVQAVMEAQRPAMEAIRNDSSLTREQRREKMQAIRQGTDGQMSAILTPEQKTKWDQERAQRRERAGQGGGNPPRGPGGPNSAP